jgi:lipopolysaccharide/colanic/teichoic acid biosynthesis glycosyltransferase
MLLNRHRGLAELHNAVASLVTTLWFWVYAEVTIQFLADYMRLTREVALMPYFLSVGIGLVFGWRRTTRVGWRLTRLSGSEAAGIASWQVGWIALVVFAMMFATQGTFLVSTWALLIATHLVLPGYLARLVFGGNFRVPTVLVLRAGARDEAERWLRGRDRLGVEVVGFVAWDNGIPTTAIGSPVWLGGIEQFSEIIAARRIGQVILWELPEDRATGRRLVEVCQANGARLLLRHELDDRLGHTVVSVDLDGEHYFTLHDEPLEEPLNRLAKRAFDVAVALPVVVLVLPGLCAWVKWMQSRQSPGPLFHTRVRAGVGRAEFAMVKFRTMHVAPADPAMEVRQASRADERVFPFGRFLRRHSLDEFPQFWNVLLGEMSIVGPRPVMPLLDEEFERQARSYRTRHLVKPGITGLAQSEGFRGEISTPEQLQERVRLDLHYIARWSFWLDVQITARTLGQVFRPPPAAF